MAKLFTGKKQGSESEWVREPYEWFVCVRVHVSIFFPISHHDGADEQAFYPAEFLIKNQDLNA